VVHVLLLVGIAIGFSSYFGSDFQEPVELSLTVSQQEHLQVDDFGVPLGGDVGGAPPDTESGVPAQIESPSQVVASWEPIETAKTAPIAVQSTVLPGLNWATPTGAATGGGLEGRGGGLKGELVRGRGGNEQSETAVLRGLRWLVAHQRDDGGWRFNHHDGPCRGHCRHPGDFASTTASTALALLPFYGAGYTHKKGEFKEAVNRGLYYLGTQMFVTPHGGDFQQGSMYGQGLAAIVICEAYAMTRDENLKDFAQAAVDFICHAQHPEGGWRYLPGQPGDTTVTGWQLMALKSARMADLRVSYDVLYRVTQFLDGVEADQGAQYGYQTAEARPATTAIGLYCRMLTGWYHDHPALKRGVAYLDQHGPSPNDMYFNYYATQVMNHYDGPTWRRWNEKMRDQLVRDQATGGHESGSWYYDHKHSKVGGRLYNTCMAVMTLEVYYRYMPLYGPSAVDDF
jgi:hypothetical protein